jgi:hypothetical protein
MSFATDYASSAELLISNKPSKILFNGQEIDFSFENKITKFNVPDKGILTFEF